MISAVYPHVLMDIPLKTGPPFLPKPDGTWKSDAMHLATYIFLLDRNISGRIYSPIYVSRSQNYTPSLYIQTAYSGGT